MKTINSDGKGNESTAELVHLKGAIRILQLRGKESTLR